MKDNSFNLIFVTITLLLELKMFDIKKRILVIDDVKKNLQVVGEVLNSISVEVIVSDNSQKAVQLTQKYIPDLILLDVMMPHISGIEVCKELKKIDEIKDIPVIFLTAKTDTEDIVEGFNAGAVDYITKPFIKDELISRVNIHLDLSQKRNDLLRYVKLVDKYIMTTVTNKDEQIIYASEAFLSRSGFTKDEVIGNTHRLLRNDKYDPSKYLELKETIRSLNRWSGEILNKTKTGEDYWISTQIEPVLSSHGEHLGYQAIMTDITDKKTIEYISTIDTLTNIYNRGKIESILEYEVKKIKRENSLLSLLLIDLDDFKSVNDTYGHHVGDEVLKDFAVILKSCIRQTDSYGRWGGEEFLVVLPATDKEGAMKVANKICTNTQNHKFENVGTKTCSIGCYTLEDKDTLESSVSKADKAMYRSKQNGKNQAKAY